MSDKQWYMIDYEAADGSAVSIVVNCHLPRERDGWLVFGEREAVQRIKAKFVHSILVVPEPPANNVKPLVASGGPCKPMPAPRTDTFEILPRQSCKTVTGPDLIMTSAGIFERTQTGYRPSRNVERDEKIAAIRAAQREAQRIKDEKDAKTESKSKAWGEAMAKAASTARRAVVERREGLIYVGSDGVVRFLNDEDVDPQVFEMIDEALDD